MKSIGCALALILGMGLSNSAPAQSDSCALDQPPKSAMRTVMFGEGSTFTEFIFPDPRKLPTNYTGCLTVWIQGPGATLPVTVASYKNGQIETVEHPELNFSCHYEPNQEWPKRKGRGICRQSQYVSIRSWQKYPSQKFEFAWGEKSPWIGGGIVQCENLLEGINALSWPTSVPPPPSKRFGHALTWRELKRAPGVQDPPFKPVSIEKLEALMVAYLTTSGMDRFGRYVDFLDRDSAFLKKYGSLITPNLKDEQKRLEVVSAIKAAVQKFSERGGTARLLAFKDVLPADPRPFGIVQLDYRAGTPPRPSSISPAVAELDPTIAVGVNATTLELAGEADAFSGYSVSYLLLNGELYRIVNESVGGGTTLTSMVHRNDRICSIERRGVPQ